VDTEAITRYLHHVMPEARVVAARDLRRIFGGASRHTWSVDASWRDRDGAVDQGLIVRIDPAASLLETDREIELNVYRGLQDSCIPVPVPLWHESSPEWLGGAFFVMTRVDGCDEARRLIFTEPFRDALAGLARHHFEIGGEISSFDWEAAGWDFLEPPTPETCWERELGQWERIIEENRTDTQPVVRLAIAWLRAHPPPPAQRISVVHADYRLGNVLHDETGVIKAVLDWEMCHLGDPLEDLAWTSMPNWRRGHPTDPGGVMSKEAAHAIWSQRSGLRVDPTAYRWWEIFSQVKALAIWVTGGRSFADGRSDDTQLAWIAVNFMPQEDERLLRMLGWYREPD